MGLVFGGLSSHLEVSCSQSTWYQSRFSLPGREGVTWCCELVVDRRFSAGWIQTSRKRRSITRLWEPEPLGCCCGSYPCMGCEVALVVLVCSICVFLPVFNASYWLWREEWVSFLPDQSVGCRAGWHVVNSKRDSWHLICLYMCVYVSQELAGFLLCLHTVLTFCKFNGHVVIHSYTTCFHSLLFYCILTANSFICIPPPYSFTSFSKRLRGDDVRNPFWLSFPFSLPPPFQAFVCSPS